jgi:adenylate kinase
LILFLGPPGAGKSVQAKLLADEGKVQWLSVGRLLREKLDGENRQDMIEGRLVDDDTVNEIIKSEIESLPLEPKILIDGFPRRLSQAKWLERYILSTPRMLSQIIHITLSEEEIIRRLSERGREDDTEETIHIRLKQYVEVAQPVVEAFKKHSVPVSEIDGQGTVEEVHQRILEVL